MKLSELYRAGTERLKHKDIENAAFDAMQLLLNSFGIDKTCFLCHGDDDADENSVNCFMSDIDRRANGEPLQYILGRWEFMGNEFFVGEGVLIPRPETELLVELAASHIGDKDAVMYDLCAGSGCIGISSALICKGLTVYAFELSETALGYLNKNIAHNDVEAVTAVAQDVLRYGGGKYPPADVIVSNPPYIQTSMLSTLQREVRLEPAMALDGGDDGLDFYRAICKHWLPELKPGGLIAVECGIGQARQIAEMFEMNHCSAVEIIKDYGGIERIVKGERTVC